MCAIKVPNKTVQSIIAKPITGRACLLNKSNLINRHVKSDIRMSAIQMSASQIRLCKVSTCKSLSHSLDLSKRYLKKNRFLSI